MFCICICLRNSKLVTYTYSFTLSNILIRSKLIISQLVLGFFFFYKCWQNSIQLWLKFLWDSVTGCEELSISSLAYSVWFRYRLAGSLSGRSGALRVYRNVAAAKNGSNQKVLLPFASLVGEGEEKELSHVSRWVGEQVRQWQVRNMCALLCRLCCLNSVGIATPLRYARIGENTYAPAH